MGIDNAVKKLAASRGMADRVAPGQELPAHAMVEPTKPHPRSSSQSYSVSPSGKRGWRVAGLGLAALAAFQLFSCKSTSTWQPYERPENGLAAQIADASNQRDASGGYLADGSCVGCHTGLSLIHI